VKYVEDVEDLEGRVCQAHDLGIKCYDNGADRRWRELDDHFLGKRFTVPVDFLGHDLADDTLLLPIDGQLGTASGLLGLTGRHAFALFAWALGDGYVGLLAVRMDDLALLRCEDDNLLLGLSRWDFQMYWRCASMAGWCVRDRPGGCLREFGVAGRNASWRWRDDDHGRLWLGLHNHGWRGSNHDSWRRCHDDPRWGSNNYPGRWSGDNYGWRRSVDDYRRGRLMDDHWRPGRRRVMRGAETAAVRDTSGAA
jgi:hypothetical protein